MKRFVLFLIFAAVMLPAVSQKDEERLLRERLDSISEATNYAVKKNRMSEAYQLAHTYCSLCDTTKATSQYSFMLSLLGYEAAEASRYDEAISIARRVVDVRRRAADCPTRHIATALSDEAVYLSNKGRYDEAIACCEQALLLFDDEAYKNDKHLPVVLANMSVFLSQRGNTGDEAKSIEYGERALYMFKKNSRGYINTLNNLAVSYAKSGNISKADELSRTVLKVGRKVYENDHAAYAVMLANHAARLADIRAYATAISFAEEAEAGFIETGQTRSAAYARLLVNHAVMLTAMERYDESKALLEQAQPLLADIVGTAHPDYIRCMSELAVVSHKKGDSEQAEDYNRRLATDLVTDSLIDVPQARLLDKRAEIAAAAGNYEQAVQLGRTAFQAFYRAGHRAEAAEASNRLGVFHIALHDYATAIADGRTAITLLQGEKSDKNEALCADAYNIIGMGHYYATQYDSARSCALEAVRLYHAAADTLGSAYAKALSNLALYTYAIADTARAISIALQACARQEAVLGEDHPDNVALYFNIARFYYGYDAPRAVNFYHRAMQLQMSVVRNNFSHRTTSEREVFWNSKSYLFRAAPIFAYAYIDNDSMLVDAYNAQLFTKGLLLNSEIDFRSFLLATGDSVLLGKYEQLELLRRDIDAAYSLPPDMRIARVRTASAEATRLERELMKECKRFGDFMSGFDGDFRDVAQALRDDEMAVELMTTNVSGGGTTYMALYLRHGWDAPRCKILFSESELQDLGYDKRSLTRALTDRAAVNQIYTNQQFGHLVWGHLLPELADVKTIYFAPTGIFYALGAEYLAMDSLRTMADSFELHRVSSTRLLTKRDATHGNYGKAVVFGGLKYDMTALEIQLAHEEIPTFDFVQPDDPLFDLAYADELSTIDSLATRGGVGELPGAYAEAESVGESLMQADIPTTMFLRERGTEEAFKALNNLGANLIHIATHGFALTAETAVETGFPIVGSVADPHPLSRTGLLLAGANYVLGGGKLENGIEDGILTAREISLLDLTTTDLVVLSACSTAAGEVRDDGVFGLQRGFKKAGATTLLMSLWSVDDTATMTMMKAFYEALTHGATKHDAFKQAQATLRTAGFAAPFYWASFIMLDDL